MARSWLGDKCDSKTSASIAESVDYAMKTAGCVYCQRLTESNYQQPRAVVTQVLSDATRSVIRLEVDWGSWQPRHEAVELAPASLYAARHPHAEVLQLHQLRSARDNSLTFETIGKSGGLPLAGDQFVFGVWWIPDTTVLVNTPAHWRKALATGHNHCLLCWKDLDDAEAYAPGTAKNDWACPSCYAEYIEHGPPWARRDA
jgi:hypothetical protein